MNEEIIEQATTKSTIALGAAHSWGWVPNDIGEWGVGFGILASCVCMYRSIRRSRKDDAEARLADKNSRLRDLEIEAKEIENKALREQGHKKIIEP